MKIYHRSTGIPRQVIGVGRGVEINNRYEQPTRSVTYEPCRVNSGQ